MTDDIATSVRESLSRLARETQRPTQEILQYYGLERFLYRLSQSHHAGRFVLKGARSRLPSPTSSKPWFSWGPSTVA